MNLTRLKNKIRLLFRKKIKRISGVSTDYYADAILTNASNKDRKKYCDIKHVKIIWRDPKTNEDVLFCREYDTKLTKDKRVILQNKYDSKVRIGKVFTYSQCFPPIFDKNETLIEYNIIGVEI